MYLLEFRGQRASPQSRRQRTAVAALRLSATGGRALPGAGLARARAIRPATPGRSRAGARRQQRSSCPQRKSVARSRASTNCPCSAPGALADLVHERLLPPPGWRGRGCRNTHAAPPGPAAESGAAVHCDYRFRSQHDIETLAKRRHGRPNSSKRFSMRAATASMSTH